MIATTFLLWVLESNGILVLKNCRNLQFAFFTKIFCAGEIIQKESIFKTNKYNIRITLLIKKLHFYPLFY